MNNLDKECIKADISNIDKQLISLNKNKIKIDKDISKLTKKRFNLQLSISDTSTEDERLRDEYSIKYCFDTIRDEGCLWDLRFWNGEKRYFEVIDWLDSIIDINKNADKNCGHTSFCIYILLVIHKVGKDKVVDAVMENNKVSYRDNQGELV